VSQKVSQPEKKDAFILPKPCPFCGEVMIYVDRLQHGFALVRCSMCEARMPDRDFKTAVKKWNQRIIIEGAY